MKESHETYGRARDRVLAAHAEILAAAAELDSATDAVREEFDAAWDANRVAVEASQDAITAGLQAQARVETECGTAARARYSKAGGVGLIMLTEQEQARVDAARAVVAQARDGLDAARERFKAGVTAEQLEHPGAV